MVAEIAKLLSAKEAEIARLVDRVEQLRGGLKWCSGRLLDANDIEASEMAMEIAGDMENSGQHQPMNGVIDAAVRALEAWDSTVLPVSNDGELLAACQCGKTPTDVYVYDAGQGGKWANVAPNCCGEWMIEFRTNYKALDSDECKRLAVEAWNSAPRAATNQLQGAAFSRSRCKRLLGWKEIEMDVVDWLDAEGTPEAHAARDEIKRLLDENHRLKEALFFWLPNIPAIGNECTDRMTNDAALLIGYMGRIDDSAEGRGWIALTPNRLVDQLNTMPTPPMPDGYVRCEYAPAPRCEFIAYRPGLAITGSMRPVWFMPPNS